MTDNPIPAIRRDSALAVLCLVYLLNFLDRTLIYILFGPIKQELVFTDTQLAALGTTSFVLFYTLLGVPFGRLADRVSRPKLIAAGLITWSVFSAATGLATGFWSIFFCRVMVGVGEATLGPAAMSLLSDLYPPERRATVQSIYSAGIPLGAAAALFGGGALAGIVGWRATFLVLGLPGVLLAMAVLTLPEPPRTLGPPADGRWQDIAAIAPLRWHMGGYALLAVAANSLSIWVPMLLHRLHEIPLATIGTLTGASMATAGGLGTAFGGVIADRWRRTGQGGRLRFSSALAVAAVPPWIVLLTATSQVALFGSFFVLAGLGLAWLGPAAADVHALVGAQRKGVGTAVYYFVVNLLGYGVAPLCVGSLSDRLADGTADGLRLALLSAPLSCIAAAVVLQVAARKVDGAAAAPSFA